MKLDKTIGPELHRIRPLEKYDEKVFAKLYKLCKPVIKNLAREMLLRECPEQEPDKKKKQNIRHIWRSYYEELFDD